MIILAIKINLYIPYSKSIKDKRNIVRKIKEKLKMKFNLNVAELLIKNNKNASIGIVICNNQKKILEKLLTKLEEYCNLNFIDIVDKYEYNYFYF